MPKSLAPSFSDFLFLAIVAWLFLFGEDSWSRLLLDGDTGWHIRTGEWILAHGQVPSHDLFSFSKNGEPWFAWEWGADIIYAKLHQWWGLKGIVVLAAAQIGLFATLIARLTLWSGANTLITIAATMLAVGASSLHYLARPHLFTLMLLPICLWIIEADRRKPSRRVWALVPITIAWTNLHGGFLALIAFAGLLVAGTFGEALWSRWRGEPADWDQPRRYAIVLVLCGLATFVNPYGYHLHSHIAAYLNSDWIRTVVQEFQSPSFRAENLLQYEMLLLAGLLAAASQLARRRLVGPLWILFWAHQSLGSVRHVTVFVTVAAPIVAMEATWLWRRAVEGASKKSVQGILDSLATDMGRNFRWTSPLPVLFVAGLLLVDALPIRWPRDFPALLFPVKLIEKHEERIRTARVLTTDQWGDYLIYRFYPSHRVFIDGRSDFYGPVLGKQYVRVSSGQHDWREILDEHGFDLAMIPVEWSLGSLLKQHPDWRLIEDDGKCLMFERRMDGPGEAKPSTVARTEGKFPAVVGSGEPGPAPADQHFARALKKRLPR
ncbi:MAG: hypothetical protein R2762_15880 [Bryobacteraceae bacterium]